MVYSPLEVWNGTIPDENKYQPLLKAANEKKLANKQFNYSPNIRTFYRVVSVETTRQKI
jgi:hypothetical protein